jgi:mono/diheme cytochrome c family protein
MHYRRIGLLSLLVLTGGIAGHASEPSAEQVQFFEARVRPILVEHCFKCHGPEKQWSNFRLDSRAALLTGGDFGAGAVPGKPSESLLIKAVRQVDDELSMPPKAKLTDRQIADLEKWIEQGLAYPESGSEKSRYRDASHWAFQALTDPPVPEVRNIAWTQNSLDHFILAKLEAAGMQPAPQADRRTLIRRATFDLTGLPPAPADVDAFVRDDRPDAFAQLVDRLLASTAYGERWGRHWLDIARYADSNGLDENIAHGNAWRYRDYVVDSFNNDKPFRQFAEEQLAGDLLPALNNEVRAEQLIATGLLSIGPKVLAEPDEAKMKMDIVDEQLDTVGKVFMGLTLGCARCHDHKFDPINATDYYGLAGVFKSTLSMDSFKKIARWHENELPDPVAVTTQKAHAEQVALKQQQLEQLIARADGAVRAVAKPEEKLPAPLEPLYPADIKTQLEKLRSELAALEKSMPELPTAMGVSDGHVVDVAVHVRGSHLKLGEVVARRVPTIFKTIPAPTFPSNQSGRLELARWLTDERHPLTYRVIVNRVWRWHFGKGLVRTPDNFGMLGEAPTHPDMLDWLTARFIARGTSLKELHRLIMLSSTYQQSSRSSHEAADPENRYWGRAEVRRLEAEAVRDALLAAAGELDRTRGGSLLQVKNREFFFDHTSQDKTSYSSRRRSLYLPVVRNNIYDLFQLLDYPDAAVTSGDRATTTIAPQALLMLNSELVLQSSAQLAARVFISGNSDEARIEWLYAQCYGRAATTDEIASGKHFLESADRLFSTSQADATLRRRLAWTALCQSVLAANEFVYVR